MAKRRKKRRKKASTSSEKARKYKRMLAGLRSPQAAPKDYSIYMLLCRGGTLYTGIAKNVEARLQTHRRGKGAAYTRAHPPLRLVYQENGYTRSEALIREARIKAMPKERKRALCAPA